jgi:quercetin dioxygenase-like cupin family protein
METKATFTGATVFNIAEQISYTDGGVVSKQVLKNQAGNVTLFSFDKGQGLSEHTAPFDALVQVLDGEVEIRIDGKPHRVQMGEIIIMPANVPHSLQAIERFKMLLTMIKGEAK